MKLLFKQRVFSWLDSYDIYNEHDEVMFIVKGKLAWGHKLLIYTPDGEEVGEVSEHVMTWLPKFHLIEHGVEVGMIQKELTFLRPKFHLTCNDWEVNGNMWEWDYEVSSPTRGHIMFVTQEIFHFADTYVLDIKEEEDILRCLMIVLAIDAAKCSQNT
ncbi:MAG: hypothetical protein RR690_00660 [Longicatena sp.]